MTGTLRNPLMPVTSNPPLPQGEALAWLLLGRAPDQAGTGELSALPLAQAAVVDTATGAIARKLKLDELGLRSGGADQFLTFGKRLTDRLYLTFEPGLGAAEAFSSSNSRSHNASFCGHRRARRACSASLIAIDGTNAALA